MLYKDHSFNLNKITRKLKKTFEKKSSTAKAHDIRMGLEMLTADLKNTIFADLAEIRQQEAFGRRNTHAEARLKDSYVALFMVEQAKKDLEESINDEQLARILNQTSQVMFRLNSTSLFKPEIGHEFFNWQADILEKRIEADPDAVLEISKDQQNVITRDIITRLMNHQSVDACLENDRNVVNPNISTDDLPADFFTAEDITRQEENVAAETDVPAPGGVTVPDLDDDDTSARFQELLKQYNI